jgi:superfamily I DNA/RNA helicase
MLIEIVRKYGNNIPGLIKEIKEKHVADDEKNKAQIIFSTVHRCKGMEYDAVQLVNDFITEGKLENLKTRLKEEELNKPKLNEEINLLYVAVTRTKNSLNIPETLMPKEFPRSSRIFVMKVESEEEKEENYVLNTPKLPYKKDERKNIPGKSVNKEDAYSVSKMRKKHRDAYKPWTEELDDELTVMYCKGVNVQSLAEHFGRTQGAIISRINKLELEDIY